MHCSDLGCPKPFLTARAWGYMNWDPCCARRPAAPVCRVPRAAPVALLLYACCAQACDPGYISVWPADATKSRQGTLHLAAPRGGRAARTHHAVVMVPNACHPPPSDWVRMGFSTCNTLQIS